MIEEPGVMSFQTGWTVRRELSPLLLSAKIFSVVNLLNKGIHLLQDSSERCQLAKLNLDAGSRAARMAAFPDATRYFMAGISCLREGKYWTDENELALSLFTAAADAKLGNQGFDRAFELGQEVLIHVQSSK